jgi:hypothetical protein
MPPDIIATHETEDEEWFNVWIPSDRVNLYASWNYAEISCPVESPWVICVEALGRLYHAAWTAEELEDVDVLFTTVFGPAFADPEVLQSMLHAAHENTEHDFPRGPDVTYEPLKDAALTFEIIMREDYPNIVYYSRARFARREYGAQVGFTGVTRPDQEDLQDWLDSKVSSEIQKELNEWPEFKVTPPAVSEHRERLQRAIANKLDAEEAARARAQPPAYVAPLPSSSFAAGPLLQVPPAVLQRRPDAPKFLSLGSRAGLRKTAIVAMDFTGVDRDLQAFTPNKMAPRSAWDAFVTNVEALGGAAGLDQARAMAIITAFALIAADTSTSAQQLYTGTTREGINYRDVAGAARATGYSLRSVMCHTGPGLYRHYALTGRRPQGSAAYATTQTALVAFDFNSALESPYAATQPDPPIVLTALEKKAVIDLAMFSITNRARQEQTGEATHVQHHLAGMLT